jgi:hypothetical protein
MTSILCAQSRNFHLVLTYWKVVIAFGIGLTHLLHIEQIKIELL